MGLCIGLDAHAKTCVYKVKDEAGNVVEGRSIPSTRDDLVALAERYPSATVVVEASSVHEWIYDLLTSKGVAVFPCHPTNIRRVLGKKNDEVDAGFLVDAYRLGVLPRSYVPPLEIRALRQLARRRSFLAKERTRLKNRVHGILKRKGIRLVDDETEEDAPDVFAKKLRTRLLSIDDPEIPILLDLIDAVSAKQREADRALGQAGTQRSSVRNLCTIPGFGPYTSLALYAEVGDITRFNDADSLAAYFGLTPSESQSGETLVRGHITRKGSGLVRGLLNQAAWQHLRSCPTSSFSKDYKRLAKRAGKKRAIVALQRKLVKCAYWILKEGREFRING